MKLTVLSWRDPTNSLQTEQFKFEEVIVDTDGPWLRVRSNTEPSQIARLIPVHQVMLVQYVDEPEKPRILRPEVATSTRFQPS